MAWLELLQREQQIAEMMAAFQPFGMLLTEARSLSFLWMTSLVPLFLLVGTNVVR